MENAERSARRIETGKKVYRAPKVTLYGDVTQLTKGGGGTGSDAPSGMTMACWIAEALYGVDAPRTLLVRGWLLECYERREAWALVVVPLYRRFGRQVAAHVRRHDALQRLFRPIFDRAVRAAHGAYATRAAALPTAA